MDTLHRANVQRDFVLDLENNMSLDLDNISNYSEYNYQQLSNLNSKGSAINTALGDLNNTLVGAAGDLSTSSDLLGAINDYLHSDSLLSVASGDTTYNPLLRDIRDALDSMSFNPHDTSVFVRDSVFARWFAEYANDSVLSGGIVGDALRRFVGHMDDFADSATARNCSGFLSCMSVYKDLAYCNRAWGVSLEDCADGGTPLDGIWTTETSILSTLFDFFHGDSTLDYTPSPIDSAVSFSPAVSAAKSALSSASDALDAVDISGMLSHARQLVDSAKKAAPILSRFSPIPCGSILRMPQSTLVTSSCLPVLLRSVLFAMLTWAPSAVLVIAVCLYISTFPTSAATIGVLLSVRLSRLRPS